MHRRSLILLATVVAGLLAAPSAMAAGPALLPTVTKSLSAAATTRATCSSAPASGRGLAAATYTAPMSGFVTTRLKGAGDWDLLLRDASSGRRLGASQGFGGSEVVQTWVSAGQRLVAEGCRRRGAGRAARVGFTLADLNPPVATGAPQLVRVRGTGDQIEKLEEQGFDVTHNMRRGWADVLVAGPEQLAALQKTGLPYTTRVADMTKAYGEARAADRAYTQRVGVAGSPLPSGRTEYRTYEDIQAELKKLVEENPGTVRKVVFGKSFQGRELSGVEIADDVNADDGRPVFFLMGEHHAREWPSAEAAMEYAAMMVKQKGDPRIAKLRATERVVILPIVNADGYVSSRGAFDAADSIADPGALVSLGEAVAPPGGLFAYRRKNCNGELSGPDTPCELTWGVDNNRNYGNAWGGPGSSPDPTSQSYHGPGPRSEPETQAVWNYARTHNVTFLMTMHTVAALVLRPPGLHDGGLAPDEQRMKQIGDAMGTAAGYTSQFSWQLYDTAGTTEDDTYAATGGYGYTIEMGPPDGRFHEAYETGVVKEWTGDNDHANGKGGLREALLIAAESAANPADAATLRGTAPAGKVLRVKRSFDTKTSPYCTKGVDPVVSLAAAPEGGLCLGATQEPQTLKDTVDVATKVPASGAFDWRINQSTRPFVNGGAVKEETKDLDPPIAELSGAPGQPTGNADHEFTIPASATGDKVRVRLESTLPEDYDLEVFEKQADGKLTSVGSSGNLPGSPEEVLIQEPHAATYVARVNYYAAVTGTYAIKVTRVATTRTVTTGTKEAYELTCENPDGTVLERRSLIIDRGQSLAVNLGCGSAPSTFANGTPLPPQVVAGSAPSARKAPKTAKLGLALGSGRARGGKVALRITCPRAVLAACAGTAKLRGVVSGRRGAQTVGTKRFAARPGKSTTVRVALSRAARTRLARGGRLRLTATASGAAGATKLLGSRTLTVRR